MTPSLCSKRRVTVLRDTFRTAATPSTVRYSQKGPVCYALSPCVASAKSYPESSHPQIMMEG